MALAVLNYLLGLAAIGLALTFGGKAERYGAFTLLLMLSVSILGNLFLDRRFESVDPISLSQDLIALLGFSYIGIYTKRIWPLWAASFQLLSVGAHFVRALEMPVRPIVYAWMKSGPTWAVLILLIIGTFTHRRRKSSRGNVCSSPD
jgi:hypothetical protein